MEDKLHFLFKNKNLIFFLLTMLTNQKWLKRIMNLKVITLYYIKNTSFKYLSLGRLCETGQEVASKSNYSLHTVSFYLVSPVV